MQTTIEKYDAYSFWEELAYKLADRDLEQELGKRVSKMTAEERILGQEKYIDKYFSEFGRHGVKNLTIK